MTPRASARRRIRARPVVRPIAPSHEEPDCGRGSLRRTGRDCSLEFRDGTERRLVAPEAEPNRRSLQPSCGNASAGMVRSLFFATDDVFTKSPALQAPTAAALDVTTSRRPPAIMRTQVRLRQRGSNASRDPEWLLTRRQRPCRRKSRSLVTCLTRGEVTEERVKREEQKRNGLFVAGCDQAVNSDRLCRPGGGPIGARTMRIRARNPGSNAKAR